MFVLSLVIAEVFRHDHPDSGGNRDAALTEEVLEAIPVGPMKPDAPAKVPIELAELAVEDGDAVHGEVLRREWNYDFVHGK